MSVSPSMKKQKSNTADSSTQLTLCDDALSDVLKQCMEKVILYDLKVQDQRFTKIEHDLNGSLYMVPKRYNDWQIQTTMPSRKQVQLNEALKIYQENGKIDTVVFRLVMKNVDGEWKLSAPKPPHDLFGNTYAHLAKIKITVTRATDGATELVYLTQSSNGGTIFYDGDQLNMTYIDNDGNVMPISPNGKQNTNYFPVTIRIISPLYEIPEVKEEIDVNFREFKRLAQCNKGMYKAYHDYMAQEHVKMLQIRAQKYKGLEKELRGFMYVKPKPYTLIPGGELQFELRGPGQFELVLMLPAVLIPQEGGTPVNRGIRFVFWKNRGRWKLQSNVRLEDPNMHITIKKAGSNEWTRVDMCSVLAATWHNSPGQRVVYSAQGTDFEDGDLMNVQYESSRGVLYPVSFCGGEETNIFPCRFGVI